jgi:lipopolysaccharide/colanic/teichoic acid biosynthesis glycosyltransferase
MDERARRIVDVTGAMAGLFVLAPVFLILSVLIRLDSPGPVLHRSTRVGLDGRLFTLYKFRSMVVGAAFRGPAITADQDTRVTRIGQMLRRTKLDELPQLVNVLLGDMSLVGPRPEDPRYVALYTPQQRAVLGARPGITSPASLRYRSEERLLTGEDWEDLYVRRIMPAKLAIDLDYLRRRTVWSDFGVILATVCAFPSRGSAA